MQRSALCRSRRELSNACLLAKIGVDTAENEPLEVWGENSIHYSPHSLEAPDGTPLPGLAFVLESVRSYPRGDGLATEVSCETLADASVTVTWAVNTG